MYDLFCSLISRRVSRDIESSIFFQQKDIRGIFLADSDGRITHDLAKVSSKEDPSISLSFCLPFLYYESFNYLCDIISKKSTAIFSPWREIILDIFQNSQDPRSTGEVSGTRVTSRNKRRRGYRIADRGGSRRFTKSNIRVIYHLAVANATAEKERCA